ncbi:MAG: matrixin family metalloprotease [Pseudomonadota bacterium]
MNSVNEIKTKSSAAILALTIVFFSSGAPAWNQMTDTGTGAPLAHTGNCLRWTLNVGGPGEIIDHETLEDLAVQAFAGWSAVGCSYMQMHKQAVSSCDCDQIGLQLDGRNNNLVRWCEGTLPAGYPEGTLSIMAVTNDPETGEINDTGVILNAAAIMLSVGEENIEAVYFNTVLHHIGHLLGLADSEVLEAVMYPANAMAGERLALHEDDIEALCTIYPVDDDPGECNAPENEPEPCTTGPNGDGGDGENGCGCMITGKHGNDGGAFLSLLLLLALCGAAGTRVS